MFEKIRIAIVYDWIDSWGGVERVLLHLHELFPKAIFYTSIADLQKASWAKNLSIQTSFLQTFPDVIKKNRVLSLPLYPFAFESFDFSSFDVVISVTSSFAKAIITKPQTLHICYLLTPARFLWVDPGVYIKENIKKKIISPYFNYLSSWDHVASQRPDYIIAISDAVRQRCLRYYQRESKVIYPPFDTNYWEKLPMTNYQFPITNFQFPNSKFYLIVSRLEPYKRIDLVIDVFNKKQDLTLLIVGKGREKSNLRRKAHSNIHFIENITDKELKFLYSKAQALLMPQEEDFGYVALEAAYCGCPVIAFKKGGAVETILDGKTGIFFDRQTASSLAGAVARFAKIAYNLKTNTKKYGREHVMKFDSEIFKKTFLDIISTNI